MAQSKFAATRRGRQGLDLALFVNGVPVATALKNPLTGQGVDQAIGPSGHATGYLWERVWERPARSARLGLPVLRV